MSEDPKDKPGHRHIQVQTDPQTAAGVYSNMMTVNHRKEEFILDFFFIQPQTAGPDPVAALRSRIITSPEHLKRISRALGENIRKYEEKFGVIEEADDLPKSLH